MKSLPALSPISLILLFAIALSLGLSYFVPWLLPASGGVFCVWLALFFLEYFLTPSPEVLRVNRKIARRLSLSDENPVEIEVLNLSKIPLKLEVTENAPDIFELRDLSWKDRFKGGDSATYVYSVTPWRRGAYEFGAISVRIRGLLGLSHRIWEVDCAETVKVYPSYLKVRQYQLHTRRMNIELQGKKKMRKYGEGSEFESLRPYTKDDEFRKINWKATARTGKPIVSQYQVERNQNVILLVDAGRMMRTLAGKMSKLDYSVNAALMLAYVCVHKEDNVGLLIFDKEIRTFIPPRRGVQQLNAINEALYDLDINFAEPNYRMAFNFLRRRVSRRSLVVLLTDLIDERASKTLITEFTRLYPQHLPLAVTLRDNLLVEKSLAVPEDESGVAALGVARKLVQERLRALRRLELQGVLTLDTRPEDLTVNTINRYLEIKAREMI